MTKEELSSINYFRPIDSIITIEELANKNDRTLLYGYTCERATWHVYIKDKEIRTCTYNYNSEPTIVNIESIYDYIPDKRLYPECCDFEFCSLLKKENIILPFTTYSETRPKAVYYGAVI